MDPVVTAPASPRTQVAVALAALGLGPEEGTYTWFGERFAVRGDLTSAITLRLYLDFYTQGSAGPTIDRRFTPAGRTRTDMMERLEAANAGRGSLDPGWRVQESSADDLLVQRGSLAILAPRRRVRGRIGPGAPVALSLPKGLTYFARILGQAVIPFRIDDDDGLPACDGLCDE